MLSLSAIIETIRRKVYDPHNFGGGEIDEGTFTIKCSQFFKLVYLPEIYANSHNLYKANTSEEYNAVIETCRELFINKMKDYGSAWRILRLPSFTDQIFIKAQRIRGLQENDDHKIEEDETAEFIGIINYCLMAIIQLEKGITENPDMGLEEATQLYDEKVAETKQLMLDKNHDYGEAWREMRVSSLTDLILQKLLRVKQIENNKGKTLVSEGIKANFQDILNYAVFSLIHLKKQTS